jgi:hypothetical protein
MHMGPSRDQLDRDPLIFERPLLILIGPGARWWIGGMALKIWVNDRTSVEGFAGEIGAGINCDPATNRHAIFSTSTSIASSAPSRSGAIVIWRSVP